MAVKAISKLTLGPLLFNWEPTYWRDFYFRIADEAPVDIVYLGEVVCSKRAPFFDAHLPDVVERLNKGGKDVIFSTLSMVMNKREAQSVRDLAQQKDLTIEANDMSALFHLRGQPHTIGPFLNVYNEDTLSYMALKGAKSICLPYELSSASIKAIVKRAKEEKIEIETQVYGRTPLALSARCYHARAEGLTKDNCQFVCKKHPDGMDLETLNKEAFLTVNGIQTMSHTCLNLSQELAEMQNFGVSRFRLSPQTSDMVHVAKIFRDVLDRKTEAETAINDLKGTGFDAPFSNGFYHGQEGHSWVA